MHQCDSRSGNEASYRNITAYRTLPESLSVSPSGRMKNRSDNYKRALIELDEMRENGKLSAKEYESARRALAQEAIIQKQWRSSYQIVPYTPQQGANDSGEEGRRRSATQKTNNIAVPAFHRLGDLMSVNDAVDSPKSCPGRS